METPKKQRERRKKLIDGLVDALYRDVAVDLVGFYDSTKFANSALRRAMRNEIESALMEINLDVLERLSFDRLRKQVSTKYVDDTQLTVTVTRVRKEFRDANGMNG